MDEDEEIATLVVPSSSPAPSSAVSSTYSSPVIHVSLPSPPPLQTATSFSPDIVDLPDDGYDDEIALVAAADAVETQASLDEALDGALDEALAQLYVKALREIDDL